MDTYSPVGPRPRPEISFPLPTLQQNPRHCMQFGEPVATPLHSMLDVVTMQTTRTPSKFKMEMQQPCHCQLAPTSYLMVGMTQKPVVQRLQTTAIHINQPAPALFMRAGFNPRFMGFQPMPAPVLVNLAHQIPLEQPLLAQMQTALFQ